MSGPEREAALDLLQDPKPARPHSGRLRAMRRGGRGDQQADRLHRRGVAASGAPLAVMVQSSSAAGKSSLMEAILALLPEEHRVEYSAMTGQSLFYMGETDLKHKVLAIVEEEGVSRAAYALKLLQSEGVLTIASTGKDPATGRLVTHQYRVEGPVMIFLTTTAIDLDEELLNLPSDLCRTMPVYACMFSFAAADAGNRTTAPLSWAANSMATTKMRRAAGSRPESKGPASNTP